MKCPKCGSENDKNSAYCEYCGALLSESKKTGSKPANTMTSVVGILAALLILGGIIVFVGIINSKGNDGEAALEETNTGSDLNNNTNDEYEINWNAASSTQPVEANIPRKAVTFEGKSYYIFDNGCESWDEAQRFCESRGGYLAVVNSSEENEFLYNYMLETGFDEAFIGYTDQYHEGRWEWVSGKTSNFTDWGINDEGSAEPNADSVYEDYAHMNSSMNRGHWNDKRFGKTSSCFFCEWDLIDYQGKDCTGTAIEEGAPIRNSVRNEADEIVKLKKGEEVRVIYLLTEDNGDQWYFVRHSGGVEGYIKAVLLNENFT